MRRLFMGLLLALISSLTLSLAAGTSATVSWVAPTSYTDGSSVQLGDIDHYLLTWAPAPGQSGPSGSVTVTGTSTSSVVNVPCGTTSFAVTVFTSATAKYPNVSAGPTGPVAYATGVTCTINPPTGLAVH